jgi:formamidopyrimidine-DNA glycosylase
MPELPEVEVLKEHLNQAIRGLTIQSIDVRVPKVLVGDRNKVLKSQITSVTRRHKILFIHLSNGFTLAIHLKMTGQLIFVKKDAKHGFFGGHPEKAYEQSPPHQYTHIIIEFTNGDHLYFNDLRKFGWMRVIQPPTTKHQQPTEYEKLLDHFAPEPLEKEFQLDDFRKRLRTRNKLTIKQALMDEKRVVAGVGNIYSDEILFCARINPLRKVQALTGNGIKKIFDCIPKVLKKAIALGGTSFNTYRHLSGQQGKYAQVAKVYRKTVQLCPNRCGHQIVRKKIGGRSTHFCPKCQI